MTTRICRGREISNCRKNITRIKRSNGSDTRSNGSIAARRRKCGKISRFDSSVFSPYSRLTEPQIPYALFPSVVFYELTAKSIAESILKKYERRRISLGKIARVLTPTSNDWRETAKEIRRLYIKKTVPVSKIKTLQNDALIARLAVKNKDFAVTMDIDDYEIIKREMPKLEIVSGDYFFS